MMDMQKEREALIAEIEVFKAEMLKSYVIKAWADSYVNTDPFSYAIFEDENNKIWWMKAQTHEFWRIWQAAKAQADQKIKLLLCDEHLKKCESPTGVFNSQYPDEEPCLICLAKQYKAQAVSRWISTSDRMPKEGEEVLVHNLGQVRQVTRDSKWAGGFKERNCYGWQAAYGQSHWMPKSIELPEQYHFYYENDAKQKAMIEAQEPAND